MRARATARARAEIFFTAKEWERAIHLIVDMVQFKKGTRHGIRPNFYFCSTDSLFSRLDMKIKGKELARGSVSIL